jgi:hypothetical protein
MKMITHKSVRKIFNRPLNSYLLPIKLAEPYCCLLESRLFDQGNPFRRLLERNEGDVEMSKKVEDASN